MSESKDSSGSGQPEPAQKVSWGDLLRVPVDGFGRLWKLYKDLTGDAPKGETLRTFFAEERDGMKRGWIGFMALLLILGLVACTVTWWLTTRSKQGEIDDAKSEAQAYRISSETNLALLRASDAQKAVLGKETTDQKIELGELRTRLGNAEAMAGMPLRTNFPVAQRLDAILGALTNGLTQMAGTLVQTIQQRDGIGRIKPAVTLAVYRTSSYPYAHVELSNDFLVARSNILSENGAGMIVFPTDMNEASVPVTFGINSGPGIPVENCSVRVSVDVTNVMGVGAGWVDSISQEDGDLAFLGVKRIVHRLPTLLQGDGQALAPIFFRPDSSKHYPVWVEGKRPAEPSYA